MKAGSRVDAASSMRESRACTVNLVSISNPPAEVGYDFTKRRENTLYSESMSLKRGPNSCATTPVERALPKR